MFLARVVGTVVATRKDERLVGLKLLVLRPQEPDGSEGNGPHVIAVDTVDAGPNDRVLVVTGSSARLATGLADRPVDAAIVGVVDVVEVAR